MKKLFTLATGTFIFVGCATEDPYASRGGTGTPTSTEINRSIDWGGTPGTHPSDPGGNTEADETERTRPGVGLERTPADSRPK